MCMAIFDITALLVYNQIIIKEAKNVYTARFSIFRSLAGFCFFFFVNGNCSLFLQFYNKKKSEYQLVLGTTEG